ncbi:MAG: cupin domain-containing protein [Phycisphaerae bacterium]|nr:cupin domain-containing protein [Saprospiraceae bacterium]
MKQAIDLHKIGEKLEFNDARERSNGQRSEGIMTLGPGKKGPGAHKHTLQTEGFEVIGGQMVAVVNGKEIVANAGETIIVQPGESHTFVNGSATEPLVAKFWYEPALNTEWMLQTMGEDAMKNGGDWANMSLLPTMFMFYKLRYEYRFAGMPFWLQDVILGIGAGIAKLTGAAKKVPLPESLPQSHQMVRQGQAVTVN